MATIKATDTGRAYEYRIDCDTQDVLGEMIGNDGSWQTDEDGAFLMPDYDAIWWVAFGIREDATNAAYEDADDEIRQRAERIIDEYADDLETYQQKLCELYGIDYDEAEAEAGDYATDGEEIDF